MELPTKKLIDGVFGSSVDLNYMRVWQQSATRARDDVRTAITTASRPGESVAEAFMPGRSVAGEALGGTPGSAPKTPDSTISTLQAYGSGRSSGGKRDKGMFSPMEVRGLTPETYAGMLAAVGEEGLAPRVPNPLYDSLVGESLGQKEMIGQPGRVPQPGTTGGTIPRYAASLYALWATTTSQDQDAASRARAALEDVSMMLKSGDRGGKAEPEAVALAQYMLSTPFTDPPMAAFY